MAAKRPERQMRAAAAGSAEQQVPANVTVF